MLLHAERSGARTTGPVRRRERLVDVDVDAIEPEVTRSRDAEQRVHVRAVAIHEAARVMDGGAHLAYALLEEAERVRVREHEPGDVRPERRLKRLEVDVSACVALYRCHLVAAHGRRRRVRSDNGKER